MSQFKGTTEPVKSSPHISPSPLAVSKTADEQKPYFTSTCLSAKHRMIMMVMHSDPLFKFNLSLNIKHNLLRILTESLLCRPETWFQIFLMSELCI